MNRSILSWFAIFALLSFYSASASSEEKSINLALPEQKHHLMFHAIKDALPRIHYEGSSIDSKKGIEWLKVIIQQIDPNEFVFSKSYISELFKAHTGEGIAYRLNARDLNYLYEIVSRLYLRKRKALELQLLIASNLNKGKFHRELVYSHKDYLSKLRNRPINKHHKEEVLRRIVASGVAFKVQEGMDFEDARDYVLARIRERLFVLDEMAKSPEHHFSLVTHALLQSYDKYSRYIAAKDIAGIKASHQNKGYRLGLELRAEEKGLIITHISRGSAADKSGNFAIGDLVIAIRLSGKDYSLLNKTKDYFHELISKVDGSQLPVHLYHMRGEAEHKSVIYREPESKQGIAIKKYKSPYHHQSVDVMEISSFFDGATQLVLDALGSHSGEILVIDLRGNGGGSLIEAINMTSLFMDGGKVVSIKGKDNEKALYDEDDVYIGKSLIILVDRATASAAEIMAAALQHHRQAIVIGEPTYGKGAIQQFIDFASPAYGIPYDGAELGGMLITVSEYFTPDGKTLEGSGVVPNIEINFNRMENKHFNNFSKVAKSIMDALLEVPLYRLYVLSRERVDGKVDAIRFSQLEAYKLAHDERSLRYINLNRQYQGLPFVDSVSDLEEGYEPIDILLDLIAKVTPPA